MLYDKMALQPRNGRVLLGPQTEGPASHGSLSEWANIQTLKGTAASPNPEFQDSISGDPGRKVE